MVRQRGVDERVFVRALGGDHALLERREQGPRHRIALGAGEVVEHAGARNAVRLFEQQRNPERIDGARRLPEVCEMAADCERLQ